MTLVGIVLLITVFCFWLVHLLPGNPGKELLGFGYTPANLIAIDKRLGLNKPLYYQYWVWLDHLLHWNLGKSELTQQPIGAILRADFPIDLELVLVSQIIAYVVSIPLSVYAARRPGGKLDQSATSISFGFYCLPSFILVIWLIDLLTIHFHVFPGPAVSPFPTGLPWWDEIAHNLYVMLLPSLILAVGTIAVFYRLLRSEMVQTLQEDFITVARSKGLTTNRVLWRHALRPSMTTLLASTGNNIALLLTGLFIVEEKFALNGVGAALINAIGTSDYLLVQGIALVAAVTVVLVNFLIDVLTSIFDPRIVRA